MKFFIPLCTGLLIAQLNTNATVRTVSNTGGAQFTDISSAVTAASAGDTIYISGSTNAYSAPAIRKDNLTFIGTGFNVQKQVPVKSSIASNPVFNVGNGNNLIGLELLCNVNYLDGTTNLSLQRCYIAQVLTSTVSMFCANLIVDRCVIFGTMFSSNKFNNILMSNNLFYSNGGSGLISNLQTPNNSAIVDHCIFVSGGGIPSVFTGTTPTAAFTFSNNIFFSCTPNPVATFTYNNNYSASNLSSFGTGNITGSAWPFENAQGAVTGSFNYAWNFHVLPSSAAHNAASDGSDLGLYGGATPFNPSGEPPIPQIDVMNIIGTQFPSGGTMNIQFESAVGN